MKPFGYTRADSVEAALAGLAARSRALAGGTDLLTLLKDDVATVDSLIDIKRAQLPREIETTPDGVTIGALATLSAIERSRVLAERYPLLVQAARSTATHQIRNRATIGGNLLQRPRCWYFRASETRCWLNGGDACLAVDGRNEHHAIFGGGPCHAAHPSDLAGCLLAIDAAVRLQGPKGVRRVPLRDFFALPDAERRTETIIEDDELVLRLELPTLTSAWRTIYLKAMDRKAWAFALVGLALAVRVQDERIAEARVVFTGVAPIPWRHAACEARLVGIARAVDAGAAVDAVGTAAAPLSGNGYKLALARRLLRRALEASLSDDD